MKAYGASDIGLKREQNEDHIYYAYNEAHYFLGLVCDGIGGQNAGDVASKIAVDIFKHAFQHADALHDDESVRKWLKKQIQTANDEIFAIASGSYEYKGMGTTISGVLITSKESAYLFNAGDSRVDGLYDQLVLLSEDHSFVNDLIKRGEISEEDALTHPKRNMLTNALGIWDDVKMDLNRINPAYRALMITSDGVHDYVPLAIMQDVVADGHLGTKEKVERLIALANRAGGYDNSSVVLVEKEVPYE